MIQQGRKLLYFDVCLLEGVPLSFIDDIVSITVGLRVSVDVRANVAIVLEITLARTLQPSQIALSEGGAFLYTFVFRPRISVVVSSHG